MSDFLVHTVNNRTNIQRKENDILGFRDIHHQTEIKEESINRRDGDFRGVRVKDRGSVLQSVIVMDSVCNPRHVTSCL